MLRNAALRQAVVSAVRAPLSAGARRAAPLAVRAVESAQWTRHSFSTAAADDEAPTKKPWEPYFQIIEDEEHELVKDIPQWEFGFVGKLLAEPAVMIPIGCLVAIPCLNHDILHLSEELQLTFTFSIFLAILHNQFGPAIAADLDEEIDRTLKHINDVEDFVIEETQREIDAHLASLDLTQKLQAIEAATYEMRDLLNSAVGNQCREQARMTMVKALDTIVQIEAQERSFYQAFHAKNAAAHASKVLTEEKSQQTLLNQAIDAIAGGKTETDLVAETFRGYLASIPERVASLEGQTATLTPDEVEELKAYRVSLALRMGIEESDLPPLETSMTLTKEILAKF